MSNTNYEGMVGMKPQIEKSDFFSGDDDFTYRIPHVYFECHGETNHSQLAFDYRGDSVIVVKDNRAVRYTEIDHYEILLTDLDGRTDWVDGQLADIMGWDIEDAIDTRKVQSYRIEEFDWKNSIKRTYKVILDSTSKFEKNDEGYLKRVIERDRKCRGEEYILRNFEN